MNTNNGIPIVQGVAVPNNQFVSDNKAAYMADENLIGEQNSINSMMNNNNGQQQQQQPKEYKDIVWALAFIIHLIVMWVLIRTKMNVANNGNGDGGGGTTGGSASFLLFLLGLFIISGVLSSFTITLMMRYPTEMVKISLVFSTIVMLIVTVSTFMMGNALFGALCLLCFAITLCYVKAVWSRIPFAATNLNTALTAIKSNMGIVVIAYCIMAVAFGWSCFWFMGFANLLTADNNGGILFALLISFYWVQQVLANTVHVTTAGTVGTWWFIPGEANGCWSSAISDSLCRAVTYSFGSICLGSLLLALVQALRALANQARQNEDHQLLACLIECILACIQDIVEYFNKWAYVYIGLYGFGYIQAGRNVVELFKNKGFEVIISDDLTDRVLMMVNICVAALTGFAGWALSPTDSYFLGDLGIENSGYAGFFVGFIVGLLFSSILMSVVGSAINTVIVCFAESPAEFEANHPQLSAEMRSSWMSAWPEFSI